MEYYACLKQIAEWASLSNGKPIDTPCGVRYWFGVEKRFSEDELSEIESEYNLRLPMPFRQFLLTIGCGVFFGEESKERTGIQFRRIDDICYTVSTMSDQPQKVFARFLPIGIDRTGGKALIIGLGDEDANVFEFASLPEKWESLELGKNGGRRFELWICDLVRRALKVQRSATDREV